MVIARLNCRFVGVLAICPKEDRAEAGRKSIKVYMSEQKIITDYLYFIIQSSKDI